MSSTSSASTQAINVNQNKRNPTRQTKNNYQISSDVLKSLSEIKGALDAKLETQKIRDAAAKEAHALTARDMNETDEMILTHVYTVYGSWVQSFLCGQIPKFVLEYINSHYMKSKTGTVVPPNTPVGTLKCTQCNRSYDTKEALAQHVSASHVISAPASSSSISSSSSTAIGSKADSSTNTDTPPQITAFAEFKCGQCKRSYDTAAALAQHTRDSHPIIDVGKINDELKLKLEDTHEVWSKVITEQHVVLSKVWTFCGMVETDITKDVRAASCDGYSINYMDPKIAKFAVDDETVVVYEPTENATPMERFLSWYDAKVKQPMPTRINYVSRALFDELATIYSAYDWDENVYNQAVQTATANKTINIPANLQTVRADTVNYFSDFKQQILQEMGYIRQVTEK